MNELLIMIEMQHKFLLDSDFSSSVVFFGFMLLVIAFKYLEFYCLKLGF